MRAALQARKRTGIGEAQRRMLGFDIFGAYGACLTQEVAAGCRDRGRLPIPGTRLWSSRTTAHDIKERWPAHGLHARRGTHETKEQEKG